MKNSLGAARVGVVFLSVCFFPTSAIAQFTGFVKPVDWAPYTGDTSPVVTPTAHDDPSYQVTQGGTLTVPTPGVLGNDLLPSGFSCASTDFACVTFLNTPQGFTALGGGGFSYTPPLGVAGPVQFAYSIHTSTVDSPQATVTVQVDPAPIVTVGDVLKLHQPINPVSRSPSSSTQRAPVLPS